MLSARDTPALTVVEQRHEKHGKDEVIITVYSQPPGTFTYSVQCRLGRLIQAVYPHQLHAGYTSPRDALRAAVSTLHQWTRTSRAAREHLYAFDIVESLWQQEFDFGAD